MKVFVAGTGAVCAAGNGVQTGYHALIKGQDYLKSYVHPDLSTTTMPLCAQVECDLEILAGREGMFRTLALASVAAGEAMTALPDRNNLRLGIVAATTVGGISQTERAYRQYRIDPESRTSFAVECAVHEPVVLASELCRMTAANGFHTVSTACSSSLHAIGMAKRLIERDYYDACLVVGADALCITTVRGFGSLTLLDPNGCRPFDKNRAGISLGEGAGAMLLVGQEFLERCSGGALARISGWGASSDCYHMTAPHPEGTGARKAIEGALKEAQLLPEAIDAVVSHGTGTPDNDKSEVAVLKTLFGTIPPFCSLKRIIGHTLAASGILEAVFSVSMLHEQHLPPTAGFLEMDEEIGANPFTGGTLPMRHILKSAFGFGGNNAALILSGTEGGAA
jgi:3-oxoacyl-[acyl-carrier-protein] synthase I